MIQHINSYTPYDIIVNYADKMALANKKEFLQALIRKSDSSGWLLSEESIHAEQVLFSELLTILEKHYSKKEILTAIINAEKERFYYSRGGFVLFIKKSLNGIISIQ